MRRNTSNPESPVRLGRVFPFVQVSLLTAAAFLSPGCDQKQAVSKAEPATSVERQLPPSPTGLSTDPRTPTRPTSAPSPPDASVTLVPETDGLKTKQIFHPDGSLRREWVVRIEADGSEVNHGPWQSWHENGQEYLLGQYADGERIGMWYTWFPNGRPRGEGAFVAGQRDGTWIYWDEQGQKRREQHLENGLENGPWTEWDEHGKVIQSGNYVAGRKHGTWIEAGPNGPIESVWRDGEKVR